ncbi:MAG: LuxR family transcriptional regulator [Ardenticatenaceae bacterium]|nr:LuxR family transcriptional regulator [Ardenticatenaceae bacterium]
MSGDLLLTKLYVPQRASGWQRPFLVPRPHLIERLNQGLRQGRKLTLISAPAGFGKTTLIADWGLRISESTVPQSSIRNLQLCWLSLDQNDNEISRFLTYFIAALNQIEGINTDEIMGMLQASPPLPPETILTSLINEISRVPGKIIFVLDDYHVLNAISIHDALTFLLEHLPPLIHLVIVTRADPQIPLARLRARGQLTELRAAELRFTLVEAAEFLNKVMGLGLSIEDVAALEQRTEGWVAGLQLAAISLQGHQDTKVLIKSFTGSHRFVLDYLIEEVLNQQSQEVQDFLLKTAVLHQLTAPLCNALTGQENGQQTLEALEQANLFIIPLDNERRWYRYHHLFADLLRAQLHRAEPARVARLQSRAAEWCEQNGHMTEAVNYAFAAQNFEQAAVLVAQYWGEAVSKGQIEIVWSWLKALPEEMIRNSAPLSVVFGWLLWLQGQIDVIEKHLADAERALRLGANQENDGLAAQMAALRSIVARYHGDYKTASVLGEQALSLIPDNLPPAANAQLRTMIFLSLATAYDGAGHLKQAVSAYTEAVHWSRRSANAAGIGITYRLAGILRQLGRLRAAEEVCRDALAYIQAQGMARLPAVGILHLALSEVLVEQNDLAAAEAHLAQGIELGKWSGRLDAARNAAFTQVRLCLAGGDVDGALTAVQEAEASLSKPPSPLALSELLALKARVLIQQGDLSAAAQYAQEAVQLAGNDRGQTGQMAELAACRVLLAQGQPGQIIAQLTQAVTRAETAGRSGAVLEMRLLRSQAYLRQDNIQQAEADLEQALALAEPEDYERIFIDEGQPVQQLLARWLAHASAGPLWNYALHLLSQFDADQQMLMGEPHADKSLARLEQILVEPLSPRELEVLQIIALGKTNQEIARQLVVARGTVKAHTASIYRKLDVANRTEAVARARELGILL